jgi:hypothetical protein
MKAFWFNDELYIRCIPVRSLFRSSMIHEVVNRGDIFAFRVSDQALTVIHGTSEVEQIDIPVPTAKDEAIKKLRAIAEEIRSRSTTV